MNEQEASGDLASTFGALDTTSEIIYNTIADTTSGKKRAGGYEYEKEYRIAVSFIPGSGDRYWSYERR